VKEDLMMTRRGVFGVAAAALVSLAAAPVLAWGTEQPFTGGQTEWIGGPVSGFHSAIFCCECRRPVEKVYNICAVTDMNYDVIAACHGRQQQLRLSGNRLVGVPNKDLYMTFRNAVLDDRGDPISQV
jgi:hypothetical protein